MLAVVSPAKKLDYSPAPEALPFTRPALSEKTRALAEVTRTLSAADLKGLMRISDNLAELNHGRFQRFILDESALTLGEHAKQAALAFSGDTYVGLQASEMSQDDLQWAQDHLAILSGLYGVLRPLDLIQPYRLEMGTRLQTSAGKTLYAWWGTDIAERLKAIVADHDSPVILNCASNEYFKAIDTQALGVRVITPVFKEIKDDKARTLGMFAKRARGMMARYLVTHRLENPEDLKGFDLGGYSFQSDGSSADTWLFTRPQP
ncbi:MAG: peroxide stress protein YaaA [Bradymonadia bacterium]